MGLLDQLLSGLDAPKKHASRLAELLSKSVSTGAEMYGSASQPASEEVVKGLLGFTPGIGDAISAYDAYDAAKHGNYGEAALNAVGVLPFVPALGGMFVGKGSKVWDALKAEQAGKRLAAGDDARKVWSETGTFKGPDGFLRQEIDDSAATLKDLGLRDFHNESSLVRQSRMMDHQQLQAAYPDMSNIAYRKQNSNGAAYSPNSDTIYLAKDAGHPEMFKELRDKAVKSPALHELQHAIQQREGWARGGSPDSPYKKGEREFLINQDVQKRLVPIDSGNPYAKGSYVPSAEEALKMSTSYIDSQSGRDAAYRRLAGEAEARATQTRMGMDMAERLKNYPLDSYDVPIDQLILRMQD